MYNRKLFDRSKTALATGATSVSKTILAARTILISICMALIVCLAVPVDSFALSLKPEYIAHRGLSAWAPENTEVSFRRAAETDCFGIECDVWKTLDGRYVISHDNSLKRMCGVHKNITDCVFEELTKIHVTGGNLVEEMPTQTICTLQRYLSIVTKVEKTAVIELKEEFENRELQEIIDIVRAYDYSKSEMYDVESRQIMAKNL